MPPVFEVLDGFLTTAEVCKGFCVGELTILNWRKRRGLPYVVMRGSGRDTIRFREERVREWALWNGKAFRGKSTKPVRLLLSA